jgi:hypothetical protein
MRFNDFKVLTEAQFNSKQEVIDHFVKQGKSAAAGASAWERGWRGSAPKKKKELKPAPRSYHDDLDDKRYGETNEDSDPCWDTHKQIGMKKKGGKQVPRCVPKEGMDEDWQSVNKKDDTDGMSPKAVKAYRRENPGSKLKTAVTKKPSELKADSKDAKRRKSFCARMSGNKGPMKDEKGRPTPKAKALSRWNCESVEDLDQMLEEAALGTSPKRAARPGSRPERGHRAEPRYKTDYCDACDRPKSQCVCDTVEESGKAARSLCVSSKPDSELGASQLSSCKAQGLRARDGEKSHKVGKTRVKVGGHKIKGKKYGGPLPDWS